MRTQNSDTFLSSITLALIGITLLAGCAHRFEARNQASAVARRLGLPDCAVSEPMRRYQALDFADRLGIPDLADSPEWANAMSMMQAGDEIRYVNCKNNGNNFFGLYRGSALLLRFGTTLD